MSFDVATGNHISSYAEKVCTLLLMQRAESFSTC